MPESLSQILKRRADELGITIDQLRERDEVALREHKDADEDCITLEESP